MPLYEIMEDNFLNIKEGNYKFLLVSKTSFEKDAFLIFGDLKSRHFRLLHSWMKDSQLDEAYTFGGGRMSISFQAEVKTIKMFGASCDFGFTSKKLVQEIIGNFPLNEIQFDLDLPKPSVQAQLSSYNILSHLV